MTPESILSWLISHRAHISFETFGVVLYVVGYRYVEAATPEEAIRTMQRQMLVVSTVVQHSLLLLPEATEREKTHV